MLHPFLHLWIITPPPLRDEWVGKYPGIIRVKDESRKEIINAVIIIIIIKGGDRMKNYLKVMDKSFGLTALTKEDIEIKEESKKPQEE